MISFYSDNDLLLPFRVEKNRIDVHSVRSNDKTATATIMVLCVKNF